MAEQAAQPKASAGVAGHAEEVPILRRPGPIRRFVDFIGESTILAWQAFTSILHGGFEMRDLIQQMGAIGVDSVGIVLIITGATGAVFAFYIATLTKQFGGFNQFLGGTIGYSFLNELGPTLGGVGLAARSGAAIAAEIGSMVVTEQVDALRAMAVSPVRYLVVPRMLAAIIMLPLLTALADIAGLFGSYLFALGAGVSGEEFWNSVHTYTKVSDLLHGLAKSVVFGFLIGLVACQQGLRTKGGATGVGRATTNSVVLCVILIFITDFFLAQILTK
ncbi:MAG: ABC-type transport system involved in resistance to organic solvent, permease component [Chthonomonadales bacterium]|nr:ABC-type transport system involved in resistance to organic solvent, permease component [Chthonomonadales bacterium]